MDIWTGRWKVVTLAVLSLWLTACGSSPVIPKTTAVPVSLPTVEIVEVPDIVCRAATQMRLQLQTSQDLASDPAGEWRLHTPDGEVIQQGYWPVRDGTVLIPFPQGQPLASGQYTVVLSWQDTDLAESIFLVDSRAPTIADLSLSLTPGGATFLRLPSYLRGFYVEYQFQGGCLGAPYWATVWDTAGEILCNQSGVLTGTEERGAFACYRADSGVLEAGAYHLEMTLMEETAEEIDFVVEAGPDSLATESTPVPIAAAPPVVCDDLFAAAGLTSDGEPFLPLVLFDWYTQAVYAGARCRNLYPGAVWSITWIREGNLVREGQGQWQGAAEGVVWDSLTGMPGNPFLPPGAYTVTLTVEDLSRSASFSVYEYQPVTTTDGDVGTE